MLYLTLDEYRCEVCRILKNYFRNKKSIKFMKMPLKQYHTLKNLAKVGCCDGLDEELIGKCVKRMVESDKGFTEGKSKLDIKKYRRMNVIYEARSYVQQSMKYQNKYPSINDFTLMVNTKGPVEILEDKEEKDRMIYRVERSSLGYKQKKYILELLGGKALIDIAHENKTTRPVVARIIGEGVSKLKGEI